MCVVHDQLISVQHCLPRQWPDGPSMVGRFGFNQLHREGVVTGQFNTGHRRRTGRTANIASLHVRTSWAAAATRHKSVLTTYCLQLTTAMRGGDALNVTPCTVWVVHTETERDVVTVSSEKKYARSAVDTQTTQARTLCARRADEDIFIGLARTR